MNIFDSLYDGGFTETLTSEKIASHNDNSQSVGSYFNQKVFATIKFQQHLNLFDSNFAPQKNRGINITSNL